MASENKRLFNVSECVSDRSGVVVFVRKDGEYYCSDSFHEALKEIFNTRATVEYIDHDNNYKSVRVDASVDADKQNITLHIPAEFGSTEKALRLTYNIEGTFTAEEIACGSGGPQMVEKVLMDDPEAVFTEVQEGTFMFEIPYTRKIVPGQTYNVEIDGSKFSCVAGSATMEEMAVSYIGNAALIPTLGVSADTGEPFMAASVTGALIFVIAAPATYDDKPTRTFSIKITTMEEKSSSGGMMRINVTASVDEYDNDVYSADKTYQEILDAIVAGILPYCVLGNGVYMLSVSEELSSIATYARAYCHHFARVDCLGGMPSIYSISIDAYDNVSVSNYLLAVAQG